MRKVIDEVAPDANMNSHEQGNVGFSDGDEYSEILEEDGQLDKEHTQFI